MKKFKKSTVIPCALLIYLIIMAVYGFEYHADDKLFYWGTISGTLLVIIILHFALKKKEKFEEERNKDNKKED